MADRPKGIGSNMTEACRSSMRIEIILAVEPVGNYQIVPQNVIKTIFQK